MFQSILSVIILGKIYSKELRKYRTNKVSFHLVSPNVAIKKFTPKFYNVKRKNAVFPRVIYLIILFTVIPYGNICYHIITISSPNFSKRFSYFFVTLQ